MFSGNIGAVDAEFCPGLPPPHGETQVLVFNGLHFATDLHNGNDHFAMFQLVDNRGLSCGIKVDHQNTRTRSVSTVTRSPTSELTVDRRKRMMRNARQCLRRKV